MGAARVGRVKASGPPADYTAGWESSNASAAAAATAAARVTIPQQESGGHTNVPQRTSSVTA